MIAWGKYIESDNLVLISSALPSLHVAYNTQGVSVVLSGEKKRGFSGFINLILGSEFLEEIPSFLNQFQRDWESAKGLQRTQQNEMWGNLSAAWH